MFINGQQYQLKAKFTVLVLLKYLKFNTNLIVLDYNGTILAKELWESTILCNDDKIEILTITGGG